jgi:hypothetical protein
VSRHFAALIPLLAAAFAAPAQAQLSSVDLYTPGDGLITRDADTGLDWLDVTQTTNLSYDQIQGGAGGWIPGGWRYATQSEVCHLWTSYAGAPSCISATGSGQPFPPLQSFIGVTEHPVGPVSSIRTIAFYDDESAPATNVGSAMIESAAASGSYALVTTANPNGPLSSFAAQRFGSFLVRETAPPAVPALSALGAAVLAAGLAAACAGQLRTRGVR